MKLATTQHHNRLSAMIKPPAPAPKLGKGLQQHHQAAVIIWTAPVVHKPIDTKGDAARAAFHARTKAARSGVAALPAAMETAREALESVARDFRTGQQEMDDDRAARNAALAVQLDALALKRRIAASLLVTAISGVILAVAATLYLFLK